MKIKTLAMFAASGLMAASLAHVTPAFAEDFFDEDVGNQQFALADNSGTGANMPADMGADTNAGNTGDTSAMNDVTRDNAGMNDGAADNTVMGSNTGNANPNMIDTPSNTAPVMKSNNKANASASMNSGTKQNTFVSGKSKSTIPATSDANAPAPAASSTKGATSMNGEAGTHNMAAAAPVQQFFPNQNQASEQQAGGYQMLASNTNVNQQNQANTGVNQQSANNTQSRQQSATSNAPASEQPTADVPSGDEDF